MSRDPWSTCALCPRLCRSSCPVATGTSREAAAPTQIASVLLDVARGLAPLSLGIEAATLCTDCGACQEHCHVDRPLPEALRRFRAAHLTPPPVEAIRPIEGDSELVAVQSDGRPFASSLAVHLSTDVACWRTGDRLGVHAVDHASFERQAVRLRKAAAGRRLVVNDGGVAQALVAAGVVFTWLHQEVPGLLERFTGTCQSGGGGPLECCGASGPLAEHHPEDAERVGKLWLERSGEWSVRDARCRSHLRSCGGRVTDALDALLELT
jgi:hypothetical protein